MTHKKGRTPSGAIKYNTSEQRRFSFILNGINLGVVYEGIPLNKPFVSCVILPFKGDSVELII